MRLAEIGADLRILIADSGKTHAQIAEDIGTSPAALSKKLSFEANLTLDSIAAIAGATGHDFDVIFRKEGSQRALQAWEQRSTTISLIKILREAVHAKKETDHAMACAEAMKTTLETIVRTQFRSQHKIAQGWPSENYVQTYCSNDTRYDTLVANG